MFSRTPSLVLRHIHVQSQFGFTHQYETASLSTPFQAAVSFQVAFRDPIPQCPSVQVVLLGGAGQVDQPWRQFGIDRIPDRNPEILAVSFIGHGRGVGATVVKTTPINSCCVTPSARASATAAPSRSRGRGFNNIFYHYSLLELYFLPLLLSSDGGENSSGANWSGRRDSNPRRLAWEASTLPLSYTRSLR